MSPIWIVPALVVTIGGTAVALLLRNTVEATVDLIEEVDRLGEIAVAGANLWDEVSRAAATVASSVRR